MNYCTNHNNIDTLVTNDVYLNHNNTDSSSERQMDAIQVSDEVVMIIITTNLLILNYISVFYSDFCSTIVVLKMCN